MVTKLFLNVRLWRIRRDEENQRKDLRRNSITLKVFSRQFDEVVAENMELQQK